jgi:hypothetical protein
MMIIVFTNTRHSIKQYHLREATNQIESSQVLWYQAQLQVPENFTRVVPSTISLFIEYTVRVDIFEHLKILTLNKITNYQSCCFVHKYLNCLLNTLNVIHKHDTRTSHNIHQIPHRINARSRSNYGAKLLNSLFYALMDQ